MLVMAWRMGESSFANKTDSSVGLPPLPPSMGAAAAGLVLALCVALATAAGVPRPTVLLLDGGSKRAAAVLSLRRAAAQLQAALGDGREVCASKRCNLVGCDEAPTL